MQGLLSDLFKLRIEILDIIVGISLQKSTQ